MTADFGILGTHRHLGLDVDGLADVDSDTCEVHRVVVDEAASVVPDSPLLADHTTLRVGGPAAKFIVARTEAELLEAVRECDANSTPLLVLGGGSNLLVADAGFPGTVVRVATRGVEADVSYCGGASVTVAAGEPWDDFVAMTVEQGWSGLEALSGIPGLVGATPIQNVGAYGADVGQVLARVRTLDRRTGQFATFAATDCGLGYRTSMFKREPGRWVILDVTFQFPLAKRSAPIKYAELAGRLDVGVNARADAAAVRAAVLELRAGKGMLLDPADHDTWSAGSFFTNPLVSADRVPPGAPAYPQADGTVKTSAAWLIEHAGFAKGYGRPPATLSTKHALAITNRGGATAADLIALARELAKGVESQFGIVLEPEPVLVGVGL